MRAVTFTTFDMDESIFGCKGSLNEPLANWLLALALYLVYRQEVNNCLPPNLPNSSKEKALHESLLWLLWSWIFPFSWDGWFWSWWDRLRRWVPVTPVYWSNHSCGVLSVLVNMLNISHCVCMPTQGVHVCTRTNRESSSICQVAFS